LLLAENRREVNPPLGLLSSLHGAFPMMHRTVFQWLGTLLFLPASKATIWRLLSDAENWKQFDVALEHYHLQDDTIGASLLIMIQC
jgi:hypothetical protein